MGMKTIARKSSTQDRVRFGSVRASVARTDRAAPSTTTPVRGDRRPGHAPVGDSTSQLQMFDPLRPADARPPLVPRSATPDDAPGEWLPPLTPPVVSQRRSPGVRRVRTATSRHVVTVPVREPVRAQAAPPRLRRSLRLTFRGQVLLVIATGLAVAGLSLGANLGANPAGQAPASTPAATVQVLEGDTAASIAARVAAPGEAAAVEAAIIAANGLDAPGAVLRPGQIVVIPAG